MTVKRDSWTRFFRLGSARGYENAREMLCWSDFATKVDSGNTLRSLAFGGIAVAFSKPWQIAITHYWFNSLSLVGRIFRRHQPRQEELE
jgi:hypothetical protein